MAFHVSREALSDVREAKARRQSDRTRRRLSDEIDACLAAVRRKPRSFPFHPDGGNRIRVAALSTFPHLILFYVDDRDTVVTAVIDGRRGPEAFSEAFDRD